MKFSTSDLLVLATVAASASAAPSTSSTYKLRVSSSNPKIADSFLTIKDEGSSTNALGIYSTGEPRSAYTVTFSPSPSDARFYEVKGALRQTQLTLFGLEEAMGLIDAPIGAKQEPKENERVFNDKFVIMESQGTMYLRHAQDFKSSDQPSGGAGSWRACLGDSEVDYQMYWYDGMLQVFCPFGLEVNTNSICRQLSSPNQELRRRAARSRRCGRFYSFCHPRSRRRIPNCHTLWYICRTRR
jgi:hypothetical protein